MNRNLILSAFFSLAAACGSSTSTGPFGPATDTQQADSKADSAQSRRERKPELANPKLVNTQTNPIGLDLTDPTAKDDVTNVNQLHIPVGRPVIIHLSSKDVIHAFSLNVMRVKQDVIPGLSIPTWFVPTKTGDFEIGCAQLCGIGHYRMKGFLKIHSQEDFDQWLSSQATLGGGSDEGGGDSFWN